MAIICDDKGCKTSKTKQNKNDERVATLTIISKVKTTKQARSRPQRMSGSPILSVDRPIPTPAIPMHPLTNAWKYVRFANFLAFEVKRCANFPEWPRKDSRWWWLVPPSPLELLELLRLLLLLLLFNPCGL